MKKNRSFSIGAVIVSLVVIAALVISYLPNILLRAAPTATPLALTTIASSTPDPCAPQNIGPVVLDFNEGAREFDDLRVIAQNMPRQNLAPTITDLQRIRRTSEDYAVPACLFTLKQIQLAYMNSFINTLVFLFGTSNNANDGALTDDDVTLINQGMSQAIQYHDQYLSELYRLLGITPTPTLEPSPNGTDDGTATVTPTP